MLPEFGRPGRSVGYGWSAVVTRPTTRAAEVVREEVGTLSFTPASLFVAFVLPMLPAHRTITRNPRLRQHHHSHIHIESRGKSVARFSARVATREAIEKTVQRTTRKEKNTREENPQCQVHRRVLCFS